MNKVFYYCLQMSIYCCYLVWHMSCASKRLINGSGCVRTAQMYQ